MCSRSVNTMCTHALKRGPIVSGETISIKILCPGINLFGSGGTIYFESISLGGTALKGDQICHDKLTS